MKLLTINGNTKLNKNKKYGYMTAGLHLAPARVSGYQTCPMATDGCKAACLNLAGRGIYKPTQDARIRKTKMFFEKRQDFMLQLEKELSQFFTSVKKTARLKRKKIIPCVRLNLTSDIRWEIVSYIGADGKKYKNLMERFPDIMFYDYTKIPNRKNIPANYHLTFSLAESNAKHAQKAIDNGYNVAAVFRKTLPKKYFKLNVFNGDDSDLRFLDPPNSIIGLVAKGPAKKDQSGFVIDV